MYWLAFHVHLPAMNMNFCVLLHTAVRERCVVVLTIDRPICHVVIHFMPKVHRPVVVVAAFGMIIIHFAFKAISSLMSLSCFVNSSAIRINKFHRILILVYWWISLSLTCLPENFLRRILKPPRTIGCTPRNDDDQITRAQQHHKNDPKDRQYRGWGGGDQGIGGIVFSGGTRRRKNRECVLIFFYCCHDDEQREERRITGQQQHQADCTRSFCVEPGWLWLGWWFVVGMVI